MECKMILSNKKLQTEGTMEIVHDTTSVDIIKILADLTRKGIDKS